MAKKILIVDDDPVIVKYLENVLKDHGYGTCTAKDGHEAFEVLQREKPDLVTLDLEMPEEWGPRFYRKFSKLPEYKDLPVIVISGLPGKHLAIKNVVANLGKPFDPDKLIAHVRRAIGEPASSENV
ncbi:MAG: DVU0259 family response regulator domain-containing protein [Desulfobacterales bacterium]|jgi:CheY-like chemotaxis protein